MSTDKFKRAKDIEYDNSGAMGRHVMAWRIADLEELCKEMYAELPEEVSLKYKSDMRLLGLEVR